MRMPFGKHVGVELSEVPDGYLRWVLGNIEILNPVLKAEIERTLGLSRDPSSSTASPPPPPPPPNYGTSDAVEQVKQVYRRMAMQYQPVKDGPHQAMTAINEMYPETLRVM